MSSKSEELIAKWDSFLIQIEDRFNQTLIQAEEASLDLLVESGYDYGKTIQAFSGMKGQIENLIQKIDDTWDNKVRPKMESAFENSDWVDGKVSQLFYDYAIQIADKNFHCFTV